MPIDRWSTPSLIVASTYTKNMVHGASHRQLKCKTWFAATWWLHAGSMSHAPYSVSASWWDHAPILPGNSLMWQNVRRPQIWLMFWQLMHWHCWQSVRQKSQNLQRPWLLSSKHTLWIAISRPFFTSERMGQWLRHDALILWSVRDISPVHHCFECWNEAHLLSRSVLACPQGLSKTFFFTVWQCYKALHCGTKGLQFCQVRGKIRIRNCWRTLASEQQTTGSHKPASPITPESCFFVWPVTLGTHWIWRYFMPQELCINEVLL